MGTHWEKEAEDYLWELSQRHPIGDILRLYKIREAERGWVVRSKKAIKMKLIRMGYSWHDGPWYTVSEVRDILKLRRVELWMRRNLIPSRYDVSASNKKHKANRRFVHRNAVVKFLLENPHRLTGISEDGLFYFLEDREKVRELQKQIPKTIDNTGRSFPVRNSLGQRFKSINAAARATHYSLGCFWWYLRNRGETPDGIKWWQEDEKRA